MLIQQIVNFAYFRLNFKLENSKILCRWPGQVHHPFLRQRHHRLQVLCYILFYSYLMAFILELNCKKCHHCCWEIDHFFELCAWFSQVRKHYLILNYFNNLILFSWCSFTNFLFEIFKRIFFFVQSIHGIITRLLL